MPARDVARRVRRWLGSGEAEIVAVLVLWLPNVVLLVASYFVRPNRWVGAVWAALAVALVAWLIYDGLVDRDRRSRSLSERGRELLTALREGGHRLWVTWVMATALVPITLWGVVRRPSRVEGWVVIAVQVGVSWLGVKALDIRLNEREGKQAKRLARRQAFDAQSDPATWEPDPRAWDRYAAIADDDEG